MADLLTFAALPVHEKTSRLALAAMTIELRDEAEKVALEAQKRILGYPDRMYDYQADIGRNLLGASVGEESGSTILAGASAADLLKQCGRRLPGDEAAILDRDKFPLMIFDGTRNFLALITGYELNPFDKAYDAIPFSTERHALSAKLLRECGAYRKVFVGEFSFSLSAAPLSNPAVSLSFSAFNFAYRDFSFGGRFARVRAFGVEFGA